MCFGALAFALTIGLDLCSAGADHADLPKPLLFELSREVKHPDNPRFSRRSEIPVPVDNLFSYYRTTLEIGSPSQSVAVQIDTGSSDLWVMSSHNPYCNQIKKMTIRSRRCSHQFMFDPEKSTSFNANSSSPFSIRYGDRTFANGTYCQDYVSLGSSTNGTIMGANFAVATLANSTEAVWGVGMVTTESMARRINRSGVATPTYENIPIQMKQQGIISSVAYTLWLNDINSAQGSLLFGGVDHSKYVGQLYKVPLVSPYAEIEAPIDFSIMLHGISVFDGSNSAQIVRCSLPVLLDSGTTYSMLPRPLLEPLMASLGALYDEQDGVFLVECEQFPSDGGVIFDLSGILINVTFSELLIALPGSGSGHSRHHSSHDQPQLCMVGIYPSLGNTYILGDTFLRSAVAVYDLENKEIALANANRNASTPHIEAIDPVDGIPSAIQAPSYSSTTIRRSVATAITSLFTSPPSNPVENRRTESQNAGIAISPLLRSVLGALLI